MKPRNFETRERVRKQSMCISMLLKSNTKITDYIRGIDACSNEIGCRPEVFAQGYRYLSDILYHRMGKNDMGKLYLTYHAGEDFLDIADGLRAIDEVIQFCGLHRGSRIGHALALGINPYQYYEYKNRCLTLSKQILLDDIMWILYKSNELGVEIEHKLRSELESEFYRLVKNIYGHILDNISLRDYWISWKLRGDEPEYYLYTDNKRINIGYNKYMINNEKILEESSSVVKKLYRAYHYDEMVRIKGNEVQVFNIVDGYEKCIYDLQKALQRELAYKGIAIETNPSSNYLIGTIKKYEDHPIIRFNSKYLEHESSRENLNVSINTDDQGIFDTTLENEYALMALALRKSKDSSGKNKYHLEDIYEWIDYIRKMGLEQIFK